MYSLMLYFAKLEADIRLDTKLKNRSKTLNKLKLAFYASGFAWYKQSHSVNYL